MGESHHHGLGNRRHGDEKCPVLGSERGWTPRHDQVGLSGQKEPLLPFLSLGSFHLWPPGGLGGWGAGWGGVFL